MKTSMNFEHLRNQWPELADLGAFAENYAVSDPQSSMVKLRCYIEKIVGYLYSELHLPVEPNASVHDKLTNHSFIQIVDRLILDKFHLIRRQGNKAAHEGYVDQHDAIWLVKEAYYIGVWLYIAYGNGHQDDLPDYQSPENAPRSGEEKAEYKRKNKQLQIKLAQNNAQLEQAIKELEEVREAQLEAQREAARLKLEIDQAKANQLIEKTIQLKSTFEFNEAETRKRLIDAELRSEGWDVSDDDSSTEQVKKEFEVEGISSPSGKGYCDYVLFDDNDLPLAVIEAKRTRRDHKEGREQAKEYADALEKRYGQRPVIFYTNGYDITLWDDAQGYTPRQVFGYYSKDSLQYLIQQRTLRKSLLETPIDIGVAGRDYQIESITRVCERFVDKHRKALIVQATGTGKTRVAIALAKRLLAAGWAKRVLFLCDRKELRKQAANAFNEHTKEPLFVKGRSKQDKLSSARIVIATYPGMMQTYQEFDVGHFDLIIADESHRSIYNKYGELFKYFDALQVGLTATPVEMISRSTSQLFGCSYKMPTANYPLELAIEQGHLVPFKVVAHTTKFLRDGIHSADLTDEQIAELEEQGIDANELEFDAKLIDEAIFNKDTNRQILRNLMENGLRDVDGQLPGKSIIFARNIPHANLLVELFYELYPQYGGQFCRVIHSKNERAEELIDQFKSAEGDNDEITIAVSVDMLDTGIDVPQCVNLVFAKPIKSKVKFWQMVGRGTRLCEHLYGPGQHKKHFLIFDHWDNFNYFKMNPEEEEQRPGKSLAQQLFEAKVRLATEALKKANMDLFAQTVPLIKADIEDLNDDVIAVREQWKLKAELSDERCLNAMAPVTREKLLSQMAPLMQWRNTRGLSEALRFDLQMINAQIVKLMQPDLIEKEVLPLMEKVTSLSMHLNEVRQHATTIAQVQQRGFWQDANFTEMEKVRQTLRSVIHLRDKGVVPQPPSPPVIDIKEDAAEYRTNEVKTDIRTVDYEIFRQEVEKTLTPLFDTDTVLKKIRSGEAVTEDELAQLSALVHTQNPHVDLATLAEFYPDTSAPLDQILRTIIGMNRQDIEEQFTQFLQQLHTQLSSRQQRFIIMLKDHLIRYGTISVDQLYDAPFNQLDDAGLDGVFPIAAQADVIAQFVSHYSVPLGKKQASVTANSA
ncbi:TPA: DEAD/DEAH box helicase family protein [Vibrio parahaemolyticus]|nr:DEAD/DEAH box helicase family protein [Vibrio parahaemolyticus]HCH2615394.1 DEAD/DEAH box helicase family protein [Vibrio parahaemolyticus]HCH6232266.1 DEAD/DEAH box helicase family protein [Vibrio parahaemolyticus]HCM1463561.1 DEAD/DEAH box helicase family protein [Vibrio parahaemolyticus]HCM1484489.1 DEAD/DEAH box helicase family protein [Vibrio parahaemolyticus]